MRVPIVAPSTWRNDPEFAAWLSAQRVVAEYRRRKGLSEKPEREDDEVPEGYIRTSEAEKLYNVDRSTIARWCKEHRIRGIKTKMWINNVRHWVWLVDPDDLEEYASLSVSERAKYNAQFTGGMARCQK